MFYILCISKTKRNLMIIFYKNLIWSNIWLNTFFIYLFLNFIFLTISLNIYMIADANILTFLKFLFFIFLKKKIWDILAVLPSCSFRTRFRCQVSYFSTVHTFDVSATKFELIQLQTHISHAPSPMFSSFANGLNWKCKAYHQRVPIHFFQFFFLFLFSMLWGLSN